MFIINVDVDINLSSIVLSPKTFFRHSKNVRIKNLFKTQLIEIKFNVKVNSLYINPVDTILKCIIKIMLNG